MHPLVRGLEDAVAAWRRHGRPEPDVLVVSGSGLAVDLPGEELESLPLAELLPFPIEAVEGHSLDLTLLRDPCERVVAYQRGRLHAYQDLAPDQIVFTIRLAALLGARTLLAANASGGVDPELQPGTLALLRDHLNLTGRNPLIGELPEAWGPRFPDLTDAYDPALRRLAREVGAEAGIRLPEAVYAGLLGPSYETPAEIRMLRSIGADLVGMSTVLEVIAARHLGMRCLVVSLVANPAAGVTEGPLDHAEVLEAGRGARETLGRLFAALLARPELTG